MSAHAKITAEEIAGAVHDVRQMLAVITGRVGLLHRHAQDPLLVKNLDAMELAAAGAEQILSRLLISANGDHEPHESPGDLWRALQQSASLIQPEPETQWQWGGHVQHGGSSRVWTMMADFSEGCLTTIPEKILREVLNNLLLNALGVMPEGGVMQVELESQPDAWKLTLQDSGPGIPQELSERIFEMGYSNSGKDGRGIGLGYCHNLLKSFGGKLELSSNEQPGACFELTLPKSDVAGIDVLENESVRHASGQAPTDFHPHILIVDDELPVREMLGDVFEELGCRSKVARDAPDAERIFSTCTFEMAIIDQSLPGMSGLDLAIRLRKLDPRLVLVLISGWGTEEILDRAHQTDVDLVAVKPITLEKMVQLLNEAGVLYHQR